MTNPTSNFGWQMPTSTDLVTDLPADFEVFGQAVDTSLADLKGGTTGQILSKTSNTDMDFTWITNDVGDITAVTAGAGLTGGGTSGAVSLAFDTNYAIPPTIVDSKGDLIAATAADTVSRLAVGSNGQILTADSSTATGLKWSSPAASMTSIASGSMSGVSTVTISSISSSYRDLRLVLKGYGHAALSDGIAFRINGVTSGDYGDLMNAGGSNPGQTAWKSGAFAGVGTNANLNFSLLNYTVSGINKICTWAGDYPGNTNFNMYFVAANSRITAAVTSITFFSNNNFTSGTYELLGIN